MLAFLAIPVIAEVILPITAAVLTTVATHKCDTKHKKRNR